MAIDDLLWAGADAQARALREGAITAPELTEAVLSRIEALNPTLNAFRAVYAELARKAATEAQRRIDAGERTPLLGVPVAVKDDLDVEGDVTGMGGRPQFPPAEQDSSAVARLRAAGAVIIGRTHVPERCLWPFTETVTHGATRNPWHLQYTAGGSSGGSAASVAAGIVGAATGSDGGGSVRIPAAACGVFGLKTTRGLVALDREGWHGLSTLGPIGRRVADAAAMLDVIAEPGEASGEAPYRAAVDADPGRLRIALSWRTPLGKPPVEAQRRRATLEAAEKLSALGHEVVEADPALGARPLPQFLTRYLRGVSDDVAELPHPEWLEVRTRKIAWIGRRISDQRLATTMAAEAGLGAIMRDFFGRFDLLLQPALTGRPHRVGQFHGRGLSVTWTAVSMSIAYFPTWNVLGYPAATLPVGRDTEGVPMGVQLVGPAFAERRLLSVAGQFERAHPWTADRPPVVDQPRR